MVRLAPWLLVLALCGIGCSPSDPDPVAARPATEAIPDRSTATAPPSADDQENSEFWIDVRSPEEFAAGHLEGAINIPQEQIAERIGAVVVDQSRPIVVYCRSGRRSGLARETLLGLGYREVRNAGGYEDLRAIE